MVEIVKLLVVPDGTEEELDNIFVKLFEEFCKNEIPILGFIHEPGVGGYVVGVKECFQDIFKSGYKLEDFDFYKYILNLPAGHSLWMAELDEKEPMKSKLVKYK